MHELLAVLSIALSVLFGVALISWILFQVCGSRNTEQGARSQEPEPAPGHWGPGARYSQQLFMQ